MKSTVSLGAAFGGNPGSHSRKGIDFCRSIARFEDPQNLSPARQPEDAANRARPLSRSALAPQASKGNARDLPLDCVAEFAPDRDQEAHDCGGPGWRMMPGPSRLGLLPLSGYTLGCFNDVLRFNRVRMAARHWARVLGSCLGLPHRRMNRPPFNGKGAPYIRRGSRLPGS
jgi:hypothetical protein